ncbi:hypothetical protein DPX16_13471 [Anabarilius grahami]|uniref:Uncharacterized protein n=1 Tax=Anabarilius grahami TaxID=495550 RepID=A0A3N0YUD4_ANAGA|nr:hypothetical protein DPX16_13471 [Anabarilius grahami]
MQMPATNAKIGSSYADHRRCDEVNGVAPTAELQQDFHSPVDSGALRRLTPQRAQMRPPLKFSLSRSCLHERKVVTVKGERERRADSMHVCVGVRAPAGYVLLWRLSAAIPQFKRIDSL